MQKLLRNISRPACISMLVLFYFARLSAVDYLSQDEAFVKAFPGATISQFKPTLTAEQAQLVMSKAASKARGKFSGIYVAHTGKEFQGICFIDNAIGRTEFFTYACSLNADGSVKRIDVITYREPKGMEIKQRNWLQRFVGKKYGDRLKVKKDIPNISGASLSCKAMVERVRFMVAYYDLVLAKQAKQWLFEQNVAEAEAEKSVAPAYVYEQSAVISEPVLRLSFSEQNLSQEQLQQHAQKMIQVAQHWDAMTNTWNPESEIVKLIKAQGGVASDDLARFLHEVFFIAAQSEYAVDPSVGVYMELWQAAEKKQQMPSKEAIASLATSSALRQAAWNNETKQLHVPVGMRWDLSAFTKGWIVDRVRDYASQHKLRVVINFAESSFAAVNCQADIVVRHGEPLAAEHITLPPNHCLSSSGSYHRGIQIADQRFSHFIDPRTGHLLSGQRASCVVAKSAFAADVWSSAACILSTKKVKELVARHVDASCMHRGTERIATGAWSSYLQKADER